MRHQIPWMRMALALSAAVGLGSGLNVSKGANSPAVERGIAYLRSKAAKQPAGETALVALALLKADVPPSDPVVADCIRRLRVRFKSDGYEPELRGGTDIYEAVVVALAFANLDPASSRSDLEQLAKFIQGKQNPNGSWDYSGRGQGDTSMSQYAVLGLWEAENAGVEIPPSVWDRAAKFFLSVQADGGSWNYHRDESTSYRETIAMTAAGSGSLLICQRQLAKYRGVEEAEGGSKLLKSLSVEVETPTYKPSTPASQIDSAAKRGIAWIGANFTTSNNAVVGQTAYYTLYGIERLAALANRETLGKNDWFDSGRKFIESKQRADGAWDAKYGDVANTAWAILFMTKSTAKSIRKIEVRKNLGAGTLLGGRGLPKDLTNITVAGGKVVSRPMSGAVEGMLAVLEDPRSENADSALSGLVDRFRIEGSKVLQPHKDRFKKLLKDRDPGVRKVAAWGLSRIDELDVCPALIDALNDPDDDVVGVAREGLQLVSRKIEGFGPTLPATNEQKAEAAKSWRDWYEGVKPVQADTQDALDLKGPKP